jgi:hypothetical protein
MHPDENPDETMAPPPEGESESPSETDTLPPEPVDEEGLTEAELSERRGLSHDDGPPKARHRRGSLHRRLQAAREGGSA